MSPCHRHLDLFVLERSLGTRKNDDGTLSFVSIDPTLLFSPLVSGKDAEEPTLRVIDSQRVATSTR